MKWALNRRGEHVRADAPGIYFSSDLRCPVCGGDVFPRCGSIREPHFAHYSGNSSRACEDYHPGFGSETAVARGELTRAGSHARRALGAPAIIWRSDAQLPASLLLRLPFSPDGFTSNIRIISLASSQFQGKGLVKPAFARLKLKSPPGECETSPRDEALEALINDTLAGFKLSGNFFRATSDGGVLEQPDTPLELGEDYWLVTQTQLREPGPDLLKIVERRADRAWFVYRIELRNSAGDVTDALRDLKTYLQREVIRSRPRIQLIWPTPEQFDPDGVPVFDTSVRTILVRSTDGAPQYFPADDRPIDAEQIGDSLFALVFDGEQSEVFAGVHDGALRRLRFAECNLSRPEGVTIRLNETMAQTFESSATDLLGSSGDFHMSVPVHRLWRNIRINGALLRPLPDGNDYVVKGPIRSLNAGAFGQIQLPNAQCGIVAPLPWYAPLAKLVEKLVGPHAAQRLERVSNKAQLLRWAQQHSAHAVLPRLLSAISSEVDRGIP